MDSTRGPVIHAAGVGPTVSKPSDYPRTDLCQQAIPRRLDEGDSIRSVEHPTTFPVLTLLPLTAIAPLRQSAFGSGLVPWHECTPPIWGVQVVPSESPLRDRPSPVQKPGPIPDVCMCPRFPQRIRPGLVAVIP